MAKDRERRRPGGGRRRPPPTDEQLDRQAARDLFGPDAPAAERIADRFFPEGSLDRLEADPTGAMSGAVGEYDRIAEQYARGGRTSEQQAQIDRMNAIAGQYEGGGRSGEMSDALSRYQNLLQGYSGEEGQAMREQAERGLSRAYNTSARAIQSAARRNRLSGAAQTAQLGDLSQQQMQSQGDIETDLAVRGADERRRALDAYSARLGDQEAAEYQRQLESAQASGAYLTGQEDRDFSRMREAQDARLAALRGMEGDTRSAREFNAAQQAAELAGRYGTYFQSLGVKDARRESRLSHRENREGLEAYKRSLGLGGRNEDSSRQERRQRSQRRRR